jgi:hypothetical protein
VNANQPFDLIVPGRPSGHDEPVTFAVVTRTASVKRL